MCGIGGLSRLENSKGELAPPILGVQIALLINSLEYRGNDAAGVALVSRSGDIHVYKDHEPAWKVTASEAYKKFIQDYLNEDILTVMVHTRKATKGNPYRNENNHPLIHEAGCVVHNGMLSNDDELFKQYSWPRGAETDSDAIRAILDAGNGVNKETLENMNCLSGSVAAACVHPADPTKLLLLRSGNPLVTADDGEMFYWASDKRAIYRAARPWIKRHGFLMQLLAPSLASVTMPNDTGWIIGPKGLEWHDRFVASAAKYRFQNYTDVYSPHSYPHRKKRHEEAAKVIQLPVIPAKPQEFKPSELPLLPRRVPISEPGKLVDAKDFQILHYVFCPKCDLAMALTPKQQTAPLSRLMCRGCSTNLAEATKSIRAVQRVN